MEKQELERRIENKNKDIEKINRRIQKWSVGLSEKDKEMAHLEYSKANNETFRNYCRENGMEDSWNEPIYELRSAYSDLREAQITLNKYKNALQIKNDQESTEKIPVLVEFLKAWKQRVFDWIANENVNVMREYRKVSHQWSELYNSRWKLVPEQMTKEEFKSKLDELSEEEKRLKSQISDLTQITYNLSEDKIDENKLNKELDKLVEQKYWVMVDRVTKVVGNITNTSNLYIAADGNINGVVEGDQGKARLETIIAGGMVQRDHFRIITHKM